MVPKVYSGVTMRIYCYVPFVIRWHAAILTICWIFRSMSTVSSLRFRSKIDYIRDKSTRLMGAQGEFQLRIINGQDVPSGKYPSVGLLFYKSRQSCTATLTTPHLALTACHCLVKPSWDFQNQSFRYPHVLRKPKDIEYLIGAVDVTHARGLLRKAKKLAVHHDCAHIITIDGKKYNMIYDYGIILLNEPVTELFGFHEVMKLPDFQGTSLVDKITLHKTPCAIMGWGVTSLAEGTSSTLKELSGKVRHQDWCVQENRKLAPGLDYHARSILCATANGMNQSACVGDSGSPLICGKQIIGLLSGSPGNQCGLTEQPIFYARLDAVLPWINEKFEELQPRSTSRSRFSNWHVTTILLITFSFEYTNKNWIT